jgi:hypothetical protein
MDLLGSAVGAIGSAIGGGGGGYQGKPQDRSNWANQFQDLAAMQQLQTMQAWNPELTQAMLKGNPSLSKKVGETLGIPGGGGQQAAQPWQQVAPMHHAYGGGGGAGYGEPESMWVQAPVQQAGQAAQTQGVGDTVAQQVAGMTHPRTGAGQGYTSVGQFGQTMMPQSQNVLGNQFKTGTSGLYGNVAQDYAGDELIKKLQATRPTIRMGY